MKKRVIKFFTSDDFVTLVFVATVLLLIFYEG